MPPEPPPEPAPPPEPMSPPPEPAAPEPAAAEPEPMSPPPLLAGFLWWQAASAAETRIAKTNIFFIALVLSLFVSIAAGACQAASKTLFPHAGVGRVVGVRVGCRRRAARATYVGRRRGAAVRRATGRSRLARRRLGIRGRR